MNNNENIIKYTIKSLQEQSIPSERIILQKLIFFMSETGIPVNYVFQPYEYGPFSKRLSKDLDDLVFWDEIKEEANNYLLMEKCRINLTEELEKEIDKRIKEFRNIVGDQFTFDSMEKTGTVLYCVKALRENGIRTDFASVWEEFVKWKGNKYRETDISETYARLSSVI